MSHTAPSRRVAGSGEVHGRRARAGRQLAREHHAGSGDRDRPLDDGPDRAVPPDGCETVGTARHVADGPRHQGHVGRIQGSDRARQARHRPVFEIHPSRLQQGDPMKVTPVHPCLGARVDDVDLAAPLDEPTFRAIFDAFQEYSVLVFHDQRLTDDQQMAFSRRFGPLETTINATGREDRLHPNMVDLSNIDPDHDDRLMDWTNLKMMYQSGNQLWHTDSSFKP
ncbi:MAG: hypothetical protein DMD91_02600, partial [Candidatus Rokuibacteriota bacterium]